MRATHHNERDAAARLWQGRPQWVAAQAKSSAIYICAPVNLGTSVWTALPGRGRAAINVADHRARAPSHAPAASIIRTAPDKLIAWHALAPPAESNAASEDRTHDLRIMRPTRYQLRYRRPDVRPDFHARELQERPPFIPAPRHCLRHGRAPACKYEHSHSGLSIYDGECARTAR